MSALHEHHRQLRRGGDERPVNKLMVGPLIHDWIHKHPAEAQELGWIVSQYDDPADVVVTIPDPVNFKEPAEKKPRKMEKARDRATISFKVPKDRLEDGAGLFDDLWEQWLEKLAANEDLATDGATGQYSALLAALYVAVTT